MTGFPRLGAMELGRPAALGAGRGPPREVGCELR